VRLIQTAILMTMRFGRTFLLMLIWVALTPSAPCESAQGETNSPPPGIVVNSSPASSGKYLYPRSA
jgi:hypothetical protein